MQFNNYFSSSGSILVALHGVTFMQPYEAFGTIIVYVWSQYDGINIGQWTLGYGWCQNQEAKQKRLWEDLSLPFDWTSFEW